MMLSVTFSGWAQCRLATDPDPYDEKRGVSGYMRAYAGEPDLDRIIRFQNPPFVRSHTQDIGVSVTAVALNGVVQPSHPLVGAFVDLLDNPKFEGRNGVIAEDGLEPVIPFRLCIGDDENHFTRSTVPTNPQSPYREFVASGVKIDPGFIERATGIASIDDIWADRLQRLRQEQDTTGANALPQLEERIAFLEANLASRRGVQGFFGARMEWDYALTSRIEASDAALDALLPGFTATSEPWRVMFWFGGWDADAQAFYATGTLEIGADHQPDQRVMIRRPERMSDLDRRD